MHAWDLSILSWLTSLAHRSSIVDAAIVQLCGDTFLKGGPVVAGLWWCWFREDANRDRNRQLVIGTVAGVALALFLGRMLALLLPFRIRPAFEPSLQGVLFFPDGSETPLQLMSSFPSDHAVAFSAIAMGVWMVSRFAGIAAFAYIAVMVDLPRVFVGLHYPSDIAAGTVLGVLVASVACSQAMLPNWARLSRWMQDRWIGRAPGLFYALAFAATFEMATMFNDVRYFGSFALKLLLATMR